MITVLNSKKQMGLYPETTALLMSEIERVVKLMGFDNTWRFKVQFKTIKGDAQANCLTEWHYKLVKFEFDAKKISTEEPEHQLATVRHEFMHVVLNRFTELLGVLAPEHAELVDKYEEELCTFIEHMPVWRQK